MISPIRFLLQLWITLEHFDRYFTFQRSKQNRHGYLGWDRNYKMNVIYLNIQFLYLTPFPFTQHPYITFNQSLDLTCQYAKPIFRNPYYMIITFVNYMRQLFIITHAAKLRQSHQNITTVKDGGLLRQTKNKRFVAYGKNTKTRWSTGE